MNASIALTTPIESFAKELCDVCKLFFVVENWFVNPPVTNDAEPLIHTFLMDENVAHCTFSFQKQTLTEQMEIPVVSQEHQAVMTKRIQKRLCKITLYDLLKQITHTAPAWGSLTGVRPTRLVYERMQEGETLDKAICAFAKQFDVSKDKASLVRDIITVQQTLPPTDITQADVYVSIPFCRTRCAYCSFPGEAIGKGNLIVPYLEALMWEMKHASHMMKQAGLTLRALYVGGGTPTALSDDDFQRLMDAVFLYFPDACEYTVEAGRPDTLSKNKLQTLLDHGVGRISINPQTMNNETLRLIGREHSAEDTIRWFHIARAMGFDNINMDVITGLPGETYAHFENTMAQIKALQPDSLTVHTLAIKRTSRLNLDAVTLSDESVATQMVRLGADTAKDLGLVPYYLYRQKYMAGQQENVGYAKPSSACLYNVDIMEENTSIVALGAGGISKRVFEDRELRIHRAPNVSNVKVYIDRVKEMASRKETLFLQQ